MPKPKPRKPAGKLFTPTAPPQVGDKVIPNDSRLVGSNYVNVTDEQYGKLKRGT
jgi:hypothetical protein